MYTVYVFALYNVGTHKISTCESVSLCDIYLYLYTPVNIFILQRICIAAPDLYIIFTVYIHTITIYTHATNKRFFISILFFTFITSSINSPLHKCRVCLIFSILHIVIVSKYNKKKCRLQLIISELTKIS